MSDHKSREKLTREERLAAKLRENLRRRKAQARAISVGSSARDGAQSDGESEPLNPPLAKTPPES